MAQIDLKINRKVHVLNFGFLMDTVGRFEA
jgi:hypothetical protein